MASGEKMSLAVELSETTKGNTCVIFNGYEHKRKKTNKTSVNWECLTTYTTGCKGRVTTNLEMTCVLNSTPHSCSPDAGKLEVKKSVLRCKKRAAEEDVPIPKIYEEEFRQVAEKDLEFVTSIPEYESIKSSLYRKRRMVTGHPKIDGECSKFEIPEHKMADQPSEEIDGLNEYSAQYLYQMLQSSQQPECVASDSDSLSDESDSLEERNEDTDTEQEIDDESGPAVDDVGEQILGRDGVTVWSRKAPKCDRKTVESDRVAPLSSVMPSAKSAKTPLECWSLLFTDDMIEKIVKHTNNQISSRKSNFARARDCSETNYLEIKALLGLFYMLGLKKMNRSCTEDIWAKDLSGEDLCRSTMSENRFKFLMSSLRFDDKRTRKERRKIDKLAQIRELFDEFVANCKKCYVLGEYTTIDEKMEPFRGQCPFKQYMKAKPPRYGIKICMLCDSQTYYTGNMEIYVGIQPQGPFSQSSSPFDIVMRLSEPIHGSGRNITMDNWFSSYALSEELLKKKLTMVGSMHLDRKELPLCFFRIKNRPLHSSLYAFDNHRTLVSYKAKKNKAIILLSTMHHDNEIDDSASGQKPAIVTFYNTTKSGVDTVNELCTAYDTSRITRRWPMAIFYSILNVARVNSFVIFTGNEGRVKSRGHFLKSLAFALTEEHIRKRYYDNSIPKDLTSRVETAFDFKTIAELNQGKPTTGRKRCYGCRGPTRRSTSYVCAVCNRYICLRDHTAYLCIECFEHESWLFKKRKPDCSDGLA